MKRRLFAVALAVTMLGGTVAGAAAQANPPQAAATVEHECEGGAGQGTVTVHGDVKSRTTVPAEESQGRGPCQIPPGHED